MSDKPTPFSTQLRELRVAAGLSQTAFARIVAYHPSLVSKVETGAEHPSRAFARRADEALDAAGSLLALATPVRLAPEEDERLIRAARTPSRVDAAVVASLGEVLAGQRRVDDVTGSAPLLRTVTAQLAMIERLVTGAQGSARPQVLRVGHQWAQFAGWLHTSAGRSETARRWFATAMEWAVEVDDADMLATVLSFRGHLAWSAGQIGPTISLAQAARRNPRVHVGQRAYAAQLEARACAMAGHRQAAERLCALSEDLAAEDRPGAAPPWHYFHGSHFYALTRGMVYRYLGRDHPECNRRAVDLIRAGLAGLPEQMRRAEWANSYLYDLAVAHLQDRDRAEAETVLTQLDAAAAANGSARLTHRARRLRQHLHGL